MHACFSHRRAQGFTLVEIIVASAILIVLLSGIIYLIDPVKTIYRFRNYRRLRDMTTMANAINAYHSDKNTWPSIDEKKSTWQLLGTGTQCDVACGDGNFVSFANNTQQYIDAGGEEPDSDFDFDSNEKFSFSLWVALPPPLSLIQGFNGLLSKFSNDRGYFIFTAPRLVTVSPINIQYTLSFVVTSGPNEYQIYSAPLARSVNFVPFRNIVISYDGTLPQTSRAKIFIDGVSITPTLVGQGTVGTILNQSSLTIAKGMVYSGGAMDGPNAVQGSMDDIRIYQGLLDQSAATAIAAGGNPPSTPEYTLLSHYTFDDSFGATVDDAAGSHPGKIINLGSSAWIPSRYSATNKIGGMRTQPECIDLSNDLIPDYVSRIPFDPTAKTEDGKSMFAVNRAGNSISVRACTPDSEGPGGSGTPPNLEASQ